MTQSTTPIADVAPSSPVESLDVVDVYMPAGREQLSHLRSIAGRFLEDYLSPEDDVFKEILLATQEACTNVVRHAYADRLVPGKIGLRMEVKNDTLRIEVIDEGAGYDLQCVPEPDLVNPGEGGFGLFILNNVMSKVGYCRAEGHNVLTMERSLADPERGTA